MRYLPLAVAMLLGLSLLAPSWAQDNESKKQESSPDSAKALDILRKAQDRLYSPHVAGVKDLRVEVESPMLAMFLQGGKMVYYFKDARARSIKVAQEKDKPALSGPDAPKADEADKKTKPQNFLSTLRVEGLKGADPLAAVPMMKNLTKQMEALFGLLMGTKNPVQELEKQRKLCDFSLEEKDGTHIVTVTPKADAPKGEVKFTKQVLTFDAKDHKLLKMKMESAQGQNEMAPSFVEKDKKLLFSKLKVTSQMGSADIQVEWQQIEEKYWLPSKMVQSAGAEQGMQGMQITFMFKGYKVNKGVEDSVFKGLK